MKDVIDKNADAPLHKKNVHFGNSERRILRENALWWPAKKKIITGISPIDSSPLGIPSCATGGFDNTLP